MTDISFVPHWAKVDVTQGTLYHDSVRLWTNRFRRSEHDREISFDVRRAIDYDGDTYYSFQVETGGCTVRAEMTVDQMDAVFNMFIKAMHLPFSPKPEPKSDD